MCSAKGKTSQMLTDCIPGGVGSTPSAKQDLKYYSTVTLEGELLTQKKSDDIIQLVSRGCPLVRAWVIKSLKQ